MGPLEQALNLVDKYGVAIVALVCVSAFAVWITRLLFREQRRVNDELLKRLDRLLDIEDRQVGATTALTDELHKALDNREDLIGLLRDAVSKLGDLARRRT